MQPRAALNDHISIVASDEQRFSPRIGHAAVYTEVSDVPARRPGSCRSLVDYWDGVLRFQENRGYGSLRSLWA